MSSNRNKPSDRKWAQHVRERIQASNVLYRLLAGFEGKVELTQGQIKVGLGLLNKVLPDLNHNTIEDTTETASYDDIVGLLNQLLGEEAAAAVLAKLDAKKPEAQETQH